jgi:hypothetical protein
MRVVERKAAYSSSSIIYNFILPPEDPVDKRDVEAAGGLAIMFDGRGPSSVYRHTSRHVLAVKVMPGNTLAPPT